MPPAKSPAGGTTWTRTPPSGSASGCQATGSPISVTWSPVGHPARGQVDVEPERAAPMYPPGQLALQPGGGVAQQELAADLDRGVGLGPAEDQRCDRPGRLGLEDQRVRLARLAGPGRDPAPRPGDAVPQGPRPVEPHGRHASRPERIERPGGRDRPGPLGRHRRGGPDRHGRRAGDVAPQRNHHPSRGAERLDPRLGHPRSVHVDELEARVELEREPPGAPGLDAHRPLRRPARRRLPELDPGRPGDPDPGVAGRVAALVRARSRRSIRPPLPSNRQVARPVPGPGSGPWRIPSGPSGTQPSGSSSLRLAVSVAGRPRLKPRPLDRGRARSCQGSSSVVSSDASTRSVVRPESWTRSGVDPSAGGSIAGVQGSSTSAEGPAAEGSTTSSDRPTSTPDSHRAKCRARSSRGGAERARRAAPSRAVRTSVSNRSAASPRVSVPGGNHAPTLDAGTRTRTTSGGPAPGRISVASTRMTEVRPEVMLTAPLANSTNDRRSFRLDPRRRPGCRCPAAPRAGCWGGGPRSRRRARPGSRSGRRTQPRPPG